MQPNFTLKNLGFLGLRVFAFAMVLGLSTQFSYSQVQRQVPKKPAQQDLTQRIAAKKLDFQRHSNTGAINPAADNDMGTPNRTPSPRTQRIESVCATFTGAIDAGDPTMPQRLNRPGVTSGNCGTAYTFPGPFGSGGYSYDVHTYINTTGLTQCGTFTLTTTDATNANIQFGIWNNAFDPNNLATNYFADPGSSSGTPATTLTIQATIPAGATIILPVWSANNAGAASGTASDYTLTVDFPICSSTPCSGTPDPGNTLSSVSTVCPAINFTLSLQNNPPVAGLTYQWEKSSDNVSYTPITGATGPTLSTNQSAATWYRCQVTCSGNTATSNPVQVLLTPPSGCYCAAGSGDVIFEKISRVQYGTIDNASTSTGGYENFTSISTTVIKGQTSPMTVTISGAFSTDQVLVWIDFNQNGNFSDPGEQVWVSSAGVGPHTGNITISPTALTGPTRMRIRMHDSGLGPNSTPCGNSSYGQVEDYTVDIQPCIQGVYTVQPPNRTIQCAGNTTFPVTATGSALAYAWEYRINSSSPWLNVVSGPVFSNVNTASLTLSNVPSTMNGYQFRSLISGPCTAVDFSQPATLTVNPLVATVSPTSATICIGSVQQLTLTNASSPVTQVFSASAGLPLAIPDASLTGANNTINVSGILPGAVVTNMKVTFSVPGHTWAGDLCAVLKAPNGQILNLDYFISGTGAGPTASGMVNTAFSSSATALLSSATTPWTGTFRPDAVVTPASGNPPAGPNGFLPTVNNFAALYSVLNGNWTLALYDGFGGDTGSLTAWSIEITYGAPAAGVWMGDLSTMFTDAGTTTPYVAGSLATSIYVNPTVSTSYSVVYSTATPCTSAPTVVPVNVVNPTTNVVAPANTSVCVGGTATITASAGGGPNAFQWQRSADGGVTWTNITGATSSTLTLTNVTQTMNNFRYRANITAAPCSGTITTAAAILTVNPLPTVTISAPDVALAPTQTTIVTASSTPAAAAGGWTWTLNGAALAGTTNTQSVNVDGMGTYQASVTDVNGCVASSNELVIGAEASDKLWIYPNPTTGQFQVRLYYSSNVGEKRIVSLFNSSGQLVSSKEFDLTYNSAPYLQMDFDLSKMARGTYVVKVAHKYSGKVVSGLVVIN